MTMLRITRTVSVTADIPLSSYKNYEAEGDFDSDVPMTAEEAVAYEQSLEGEDAWDTLSTLIAVSTEDKIQFTCAVIVLPEEKNNG